MKRTLDQPRCGAVGDEHARRDEVERRPLQQDVFFELAQAGGRREPELLVEPVREIRVRAQGIGLAIAAIQRAHEDLGQALAQRMVLDRRGE